MAGILSFAGDGPQVARSAHDGEAHGTTLGRPSVVIAWTLLGGTERAFWALATRRRLFRWAKRDLTSPGVM